jgi:hypothetical protein
MTDSRIVRISREFRPIDEDEDRIKHAREIYLKLQGGSSHRAPCSCPACLFALYQAKARGPGKTFEKEVFFLSWLAYEIKWSMVKVTSAYVGNYEERYKEKSFVSLVDLSRVKGWIPELSYFLKEHKKEFPGIDANPKRLKMRLWRFRKSRLESVLTLRRELQDPKQAARGKNWGTLCFAQHVADFINSRPGRRASFREVLRHFSNKRKEDIESISGFLQWNYQLHLRKGRRSCFFVYVQPSLEWVKEQRKRILDEKLWEERELFSEEVID